MTEDRFEKVKKNVRERFEKTVEDTSEYIVDSDAFIGSNEQRKK
jgi:hypothetical protein